MEENKKVCSKCGTALDLGQKFCATCGNKNDESFSSTTTVVDTTTTTQQTLIKTGNVKTKSSKIRPSKILNIIMIICFIVSVSMFSKGQDKINNYYNSEKYPSLNENAYVGGDAYNYIINANYATGYYVLSAGFMLTGAMCGCTGLILNNKQETPE